MEIKKRIEWVKHESWMDDPRILQLKSEIGADWIKPNDDGLPPNLKSPMPEHKPTICAECKYVGKGIISSLCTRTREFVYCYDKNHGTCPDWEGK